MLLTLGFALSSLILSSVILPSVFLPSVARAGEPESNVAPFGFRALEIFKVEGNPRGLNVVDLNRDGLEDLVVANNSDGTIRLFYQTKAGAKDAKADASQPDTEVNEIASDGRFRVEKFYTDKQIQSLVVGDFDNDGRVDLAFYSDPPELELVFQDESWGARREKFPIRDGSASPYALKPADLDGDGRLDLVLLGDNETYLLYQKEKGGLAQPKVLHNSRAGLSSIEISDVNGDGRLDLLYVVPNNEETVLTRLQGESGFGPLVTSRLQPIQSWALGTYTRDGKAEGKPISQTLFLTLHSSTRRLKGFRWQESPAPGGLTRAHVIAHRSDGDTKAMRRILTDVDGDGRTDIVTGYPETAQLEVTFQSADGSLSRTVAYPTLSGLNSLAAIDIDGDGHNEILISSSKEKALGVSRWKDGRLQIPETWTLTGAPLLVAAAPGRKSTKDGETSGGDRAFVITRGEKETIDLQVLELLADGKITTEATTKIESEGSEPTGLRLLDIDGDGSTDALVFVPYQDPSIYRRLQPGKDDAPDFENLTKKPGFGRGQLSKLSSTALTILPPGDDHRSRLLVSAGSYVRVLALDTKGRLRVKDQISGRTSSSKLTASAMLDLDGDGKDEIVVLDASTKSLDVLGRRDDGGFQLRENIKLPKISLVALDTRDLDGDGRRDLVLFGDGQTAILFARDKQADFVEVTSFAIEKKDVGRPQDLTIGDLNEDGQADIVLTTAPRYNLVFLTSDTNGGSTSLQRRCTFPIFEEKSYMRRSQTLGPQQMIVKDVDHDGLEDLVLLIHDRILLYLQDSQD
jgi:hypothetical protein